MGKDRLRVLEQAMFRSMQKEAALRAWLDPDVKGNRDVATNYVVKIRDLEAKVAQMDEVLIQRGIIIEQQQALIEHLKETIAACDEYMEEEE